MIVAFPHPPNLLIPAHQTVWLCGGEGGVKSSFLEFHLENQLILRLAATSPVTFHADPQSPPH